MIEAGLALSRWLQFAAAALLFGVPAFALYGLDASARASAQAWMRRVMMIAGVVALAAAVLMLSAEAAEMSGDLSLAVDPQTVWAVVSATNFGAVWTLRLVLIAATLSLAFVFPRPPVGLTMLGVGGAAVAASLAWLGHGGEGGSWLGVLHRVADVLHLLAASAWIGALVMLGYLLVRGDADVAYRGLSGFSGVGSIIVATLVLTGVVNTVALTQPRPIMEAIATPYAAVLLVKLLLFVLMLMLAALNRFVLTPRLAAATPPSSAFGRLRLSVGAETVLAVLVIAAVAFLGTMEPPGAGS